MSKAIQKQFAGDRHFPLQLVYRDTKSYQNELPDHIHEWFELVYVYEGCGTMFIDQQFLEMREGDWFIIPGNTIHRAFPSVENPVTSTAIFFSPVLVRQQLLGESFSYLSCFEEARKRKQYKLNIQIPHRDEYVRRIDLMHEEWQLRPHGYRHAMLLYLEHLLLQLHREAVPKQRQLPGDHATVPAWLRKTLERIDLSIGDDLTLSSLAASANVSAAHLSRSFKQHTGLTVSEYVSTKRMLYAAELLHQTELSLHEIASCCGIHSMTHFHRSFKKTLGQTPARYKQLATIRKA
ncbi:helix-turn-helix domain-containing protein [Paenibacillus sp. YYML68]|uniref:helix-turn-helix domain-containing protein n=1 Tax=Paenibacillus sp. YYML68 TaxID=2909250 RepID=UPI002492F0BB|nr:helix-turn-helix domain-containing protein [Paenibacillus sp. YYML68]